jgi:hypothetical protein
MLGAGVRLAVRDEHNLLLAACCLLFAVCCSLFVDWCFLFAGSDSGFAAFAALAGDQNRRRE